MQIFFGISGKTVWVEILSERVAGGYEYVPLIFTTNIENAKRDCKLVTENTQELFSYAFLRNVKTDAKSAGGSESKDISRRVWG